MIPYSLGTYRKYLIKGPIVNQRKGLRNKLENHPVEKVNPDKLYLP